MITKKLVLCAAILTLTACGGGDGDGDDDDGGGGDSSSQQSFFLDDAVQGLIVETGTGPAQTTDENGVFSFALNEPVTFKVDEVVIGTVAMVSSRVTPNDFGNNNVNIARFMQSIDTTPGLPGIDVRGLDLPDVPINFDQGNTSFEMDPLVADALAAAATRGAAGILVDQTTASDNLADSLITALEEADFDNQVFYPVSASGPNEPCLAFTNADNSGWNVCQDDIDADPADPVETFTWSIEFSAAVLEFGIEERVDISQLGTTGNRRHVYVFSTCLTCNPPESDVELQTFYQALPIVDGDFTGMTIIFTDSGDNTITTAVFAGVGNTVTLTDSGGAENYEWLIDNEYPMLILEGVGAMNSELPYTRIVLIDGTVDSGTFIALVGAATDTGDGKVDGNEFLASGTFEAIAMLTSN